jgi:hypothetical protein
MKMKKRKRIGDKIKIKKDLGPRVERKRKIKSVREGPAGKHGNSLPRKRASLLGIQKDQLLSIGTRRENGRLVYMGPPLGEVLSKKLSQGGRRVVDARP